MYRCSTQWTSKLVILITAFNICPTVSEACITKTSMTTIFPWGDAPCHKISLNFRLHLFLLLFKLAVKCCNPILSIISFIHTFSLSCLQNSPLFPFPRTDPWSIPSLGMCQTTKAITTWLMRIAQRWQRHPREYNQIQLHAPPPPPSCFWTNNKQISDLP